MKRRQTETDPRPLLILSGGHLLDPYVDVESVKGGDRGYHAPLDLVQRIGPRSLAMGLRVVEYDAPGMCEERVRFDGNAAELEARLAEEGLSYRVRSHLFTRAEHALLTVYLQVMPAEARECFGRDLTIEEVAARFTLGEKDLDLRGEVATILLRSIAGRLPNWYGGSPEAPVSGRTPKLHVDARKLHMPGQHILTINWADSGPGFSWPFEYTLLRVPLYDRYVVTLSGDCEESLYGRADLALGHFATNRSVMANVRKIMLTEWRRQKEEWQDQRWAAVIRDGMVTEATALRWRRRVWSWESDYAWA
jgi:hypothetical protein